MSNTVKVVAAMSGAEYELVKIAQEEKEDFKKNKNPTGLFPYIEVEDQGLGETNSIIRYIARTNPESGLYGKSLFETAKIDGVLDYALTYSSKMFPVFMTAVGRKQVTSNQHKANMEQWKNCLKHLEGLLNGNKFFVGDNITIADIRIVAAMVFPMRLLADPGLVKSIPNLVDLFNRVTADEKFKSVFGSNRIAKRPIKLNLLKEEKKKKEEKKVVKKEKKKEDVDPIELLPPTSMDLNQFKFWFINHEDREAAFEEFYKEKLDKEGWSFWDLRYIKYKGEGEFLYKTENLLDGFLQRAEPMGKHSYGVHMIYGEEPDLNIKGVWMWRGHDIPKLMKEHAQFEYYETKKLDIDNEADRQYIKEMWLVKDGPLKDGTPIQYWKYQK
jgi:elongation factor 1-gamma